MFFSLRCQAARNSIRKFCKAALARPRFQTWKIKCRFSNYIYILWYRFIKTKQRHAWSPPAISICTRCWCFWLSRQLLVSTLPGTFSSLPAMLPCITLTRLSFHNLESDSPTSSTTERETIVHGVILSVCWCAQLPLRFAAFLLSFSRQGKKTRRKHFDKPS